MHGQIHRSLEFAFNPGDFVCDRLKIIGRAFDHGLDGSVGDGWADEVELDDG